MDNSLYISGIKINGTPYYKGGKYHNIAIHQIEPASISNNRETMHEFVMLSNKHIIATFRNYSNTNHHIEYKPGTAKIISFSFNNTLYKVDQFINGMPITEIGHYAETNAPDTRIYLKDADLEVIRAIDNCDNLEIWYEPYTNHIPF